MLIFVQKDTERSTFLDEIGTRAGKRYGAGSEPGAVFDPQKIIADFDIRPPRTAI